MATKIYLDNLPLAKRMQDAGFNKECVHTLQNISYDTEETHAICVYEKCIKTFSDKSLPDFLQLPALGEIELPEGIDIIREGNEYYVLDELTGYDVLDRKFETALEARVYAWLWANEKKEVQDVGSKTT